ncbi:hypothetical protein GVAV_001201 [Gurleya vavrai]
MINERKKTFFNDEIAKFIGNNQILETNNHQYDNDSISKIFLKNIDQNKNLNFIYVDFFEYYSIFEFLKIIYEKYISICKTENVYTSFNNEIFLNTNLYIPLFHYYNSLLCNLRFNHNEKIFFYSLRNLYSFFKKTIEQEQIFTTFTDF